MDFLKKLFTKKESVTRSELLEHHVCPNCWGHQKYDTQFISKYMDRTKSNVSKDSKHRKAFIQQFVETHVTGIHLKSEDDKLSCPKCNQIFK